MIYAILAVVGVVTGIAAGLFGPRCRVRRARPAQDSGQGARHDLCRAADPGRRHHAAL